MFTDDVISTAVAICENLMNDDELEISKSCYCIAIIALIISSILWDIDTIQFLFEAGVDECQLIQYLKSLVFALNKYVPVHLYENSIETCMETINNM